MRAVTWVLVALATGGCFGTPTPVNPLPSLDYPSPKSSLATPLLLMPGRRSRADDFESNGFIAAVRERGLDVELVAVDAHLGYYLDGRYRSLPSLIQDDVVVPLLARGPRRIWLVGTSLGAFGSLAYATRYPDAVAGVLLLGAYLGEEPLLVEIEQAGGLTTWRPSGRVGYDYEIRAWSWLKEYANPAAKHPFELYVGYGKRDSYSRASNLLSKVLPRDHVFTDEQGGHDWNTWLSLWKQFLKCCGHRLEATQG